MTDREATMLKWNIGRRHTLAGLAGSMLAGGARAQTPTRGGTLTVGLSNDAKTYDPIFSVQFTERYVLYLPFGMPSRSIDTS
jgi:peptide/nickel transport system substrate-binding protein